MKKYLRAIFIILIVFSLVGCDQATKSYAIRELPFSTSVSLIGGLVRFQFAENQGYFLSIGSTLSAAIRNFVTIALTVITLAGFVGLLIAANKIRLSHLIAFSLLLAGSFGNLIDRIFNHGFVVDFLILGTDTFHTGILNIADLLVTISIVMLLLLEIIRKRAPHNQRLSRTE